MFINVKLMDTTPLMNLLIFMIIDVRQSESLFVTESNHRVKYGLDHWTLGLMDFLFLDYFWTIFLDLSFNLIFGPFFGGHFMGGGRPLVLQYRL